MIGMVLVTHGHLSGEFRAALEHVVGPQSHLQTISIGPDDDMDQRRREILIAAKNVDAGEGTIVLTDMFGGTPSNLAISVMDDAHIEVLAGMNLPMLIKLASIREDCTLEAAVEKSMEAGRKYISIASHVLAGR